MILLFFLEVNIFNYNHFIFNFIYSKHSWPKEVLFWTNLNNFIAMYPLFTKRF